MSIEGIRRATGSDVEKVQRIAGRTIKACYPAFLGEELAVGYVDGGMSDEEIARRRDQLFVMVEDRRIVGFAILIDDLIHLMMIDADLHGSGRGSRLLAWSEATIRANGHPAARLETFAANAQAIAFYMKNGWSEQSRDGEDAGAFRRVYLGKALD